MEKMENLNVFESNISPRSNWGSNLPYESVIKIKWLPKQTEDD